MLTRAGASTRFKCTSISMGTCNVCESESESESEYLNITLVGVRVQVLVDEYEYKYGYWSMIYILYRQQFCFVRSLTEKSSDS